MSTSYSRRERARVSARVLALRAKRENAPEPPIVAAVIDRLLAPYSLHSALAADSAKVTMLCSRRK